SPASWKLLHGLPANHILRHTEGRVSPICRFSVGSLAPRLLPINGQELEHFSYYCRNRSILLFNSQSSSLFGKISVGISETGNLSQPWRVSLACDESRLNIVDFQLCPRRRRVSRFYLQYHELLVRSTYVSGPRDDLLTHVAAFGVSAS